MLNVITVEASEFILMLLSSKPDGINGRTAFQKLGYFSTIMLKQDFGYDADYYGPYSPLLAANLQNLVESDFVTEKGEVT
jgi:uncharacterized protein YwgA